MQPDDFSKRVNKLPKWARDYIHHVDTFVGAEEVQEIFYLRDQNKALIKLVAELKVENRRLKRRLERV
jgi:glucose-6-phosphate 1-dehydrogenase